MILKRKQRLLLAVVTAVVLLGAAAAALILSKKNLRQRDLPDTRGVIEALSKLSAGFQVGISYRDFMPRYRDFVSALEWFENNGEGGPVPFAVQQYSDSVDSVATGVGDVWPDTYDLNVKFEIEAIEEGRWNNPRWDGWTEVGRRKAETHRESGVSPKARRIALNTWLAAMFCDGVARKWSEKLDAESGGLIARWCERDIRKWMPKVVKYAKEANRLFSELEP